MRLSLLTAAFFAAIASLHARQPADLTRTLEPVRASFHAPGVAAAVIREGKIVAAGVCGVKALDDQGQQPATLENRWPVGSCTKPMSRFMIGRLIERGDLSPDATLAVLLPGVEMRPEYRSVPLAQVLAHRAGIQPYTAIGPGITPFIFRLKGTGPEQRAAFAAHVLGEAPAAEPGEAFVYSNAGYCVAAVTAEVRTGRSWEDLMQSEVLTPLGMTGSVAGREPAPEDQPKGHARQGGEFTLAVRARPGLAVMYPAGGVRATAEDFARFAGAYADIAAGRAVGGLSEQTAAKIRELRPGDAAAGDAPETFFGGDGEYTAAFAIWPTHHLAIAVVTNAGDSDDLCAAVIEAVRAAYAADAASQSASPPGGKRYGFAVRMEHADWTIDRVEPGSIADKAGLKEGDEVIEVNGQKVADIPEDKRMDQVRLARLTLVVVREGQRLIIEMAK